MSIIVYRQLQLTSTKQQCHEFEIQMNSYHNRPSYCGDATFYITFCHLADALIQSDLQ